jgi:hypothetical protein
MGGQGAPPRNMSCSLNDSALFVPCAATEILQAYSHINPLEWIMYPQKSSGVDHAATKILWSRSYSYENPIGVDHAAT